MHKSAKLPCHNRRHRRHRRPPTTCAICTISPHTTSAINFRMQIGFKLIMKYTPTPYCPPNYPRTIIIPARASLATPLINMCFLLFFFFTWTSFFWGGIFFLLLRKIFLPWHGVRRRQRRAIRCRWTREVFRFFLCFFTGQVHVTRSTPVSVVVVAVRGPSRDWSAERACTASYEQRRPATSTAAAHKQPPITASRSGRRHPAAEHFKRPARSVTMTTETPPLRHLAASRTTACPRYATMATA